MRTAALRIALITTLVLTACTPQTPGSNEPPSSSVASSSKSSITYIPSTTSTPSVVAEGLRIPWSIAFLPSGDLLVTERPGTLRRIGKDGKTYTINGVRHVGEGGLLGIALHPSFEQNDWLYLYLTVQGGSGLRNLVERYRLQGDALTERTEILTGIPGSQFHDGGALAFGPDGYLYVTTGDAGESSRAQDRNSLAGKILRIAENGSIPEDNPFGNAVYSYGHRNPQGITWDDQGRLWSTEHGRSGASSGLDELNLIEKGKNYGWPVIQGDDRQEGMQPPALHSGPSVTWAPASAQYRDGSVFFGGLRGEALYEAVLSSGSEEVRLITHFSEQLGRIRAVALGPDGFLYITTSNTDGRGSAKRGDDKVIKIDPDLL